MSTKGPEGGTRKAIDVRARVNIGSDHTVNLYFLMEPPGRGYAMLDIGRGMCLLTSDRRGTDSVSVRQVRMTPRALREALLEMYEFARGGNDAD